MKSFLVQAILDTLKLADKQIDTNLPGVLDFLNFKPEPSLYSFFLYE